MVCAVLLSGIAVAVQAEDGDAYTTTTVPPVGDIQDYLGRTGDAGFVLSLDGSEAVSILEMISGFLPSDEDDGPDSYFDTSGPHTLAGLLTHMSDDEWTKASADADVAVHLVCSEDSDGYEYTLRLRADAGYGFSVIPDDADRRCVIEASGSVGLAASAVVRLSADLAFRSMDASVDIRASADGSRNFDTVDGDAVYTGADVPVRFSQDASVDLHLGIDGLTAEETEALWNGTADDLEKRVVAIIRAADGSGRLAGSEFRAVTEVDEGGFFDDDPLGDFLDGLMDGAFGLSTAARTTGSDEQDIIDILLSTVFGNSLTYFYEFGDVSKNTGSRDAVVSGVGTVPSRPVSPTEGIDGEYILSYWKDGTDSVVYVEFEGKGRAPSEMLGYPVALMDLDDIRDDGFSAVLPDGSRTTVVTVQTGTGTKVVTTVTRADGTTESRTTVETSRTQSGTVTVTTSTEMFDASGVKTGSTAEVSVSIGSVLDADDIRSAVSGGHVSDGVLIVSPGSGSGALSVVITRDALQAAASENIGLSIDGDAGRVSFPPGAFGSSDGLTLTLSRADASSMSSAQQRAAEGRTVYSIEAASGGSGLHELGTRATVTLPCGQGGALVHYIDADGNLHEIESVYDADARQVTFTTDHFSYFAVSAPEDSGSQDGPSALPIAAALAVLVLIAAALAVRRRRQSA